MSRHSIMLICAATLFVGWNGCGPTPVPPVVSLSAAHQKLVKICKEEAGVDIQLTPTGQTLWIYVPLSDPLMGLKASPLGPQESDQSSDSMSLLYLGSEYRGREFVVSYDIDRTRKYIKDYGYTSAYTEEFRVLQRNLISAISRAYSDLSETPDSALDVGENIGTAPEPPPDFFVVSIADTTTGIMIQGTIYLEDLRRAMSNPPSISQEEYMKRYVSDIYGTEKLIGDHYGDSLTRYDISLGEFLARQMETRIKFKYTQSAFPPGEETQNEILGVVARTLSYYDFKDFDAVRLVDLGADKTTVIGRGEAAQLIADGS